MTVGKNPPRTTGREHLGFLPLRVPSPTPRGMALFESRHVTRVLGLKYFVCVVIHSACQDTHEQQSQAGELINYICVCV